MSYPTKNRQQSLSGALSVSLGLSSSFNKNSTGNFNQNIDQATYLGRSYLGFNNNASNLRRVTSSGEYSGTIDDLDIHDQTANIADDDLFYEETNELNNNNNNSPVPQIYPHSIISPPLDETSSLLNTSSFLYNDPEAQNSSKYLSNNINNDADDDNDDSILKDLSINKIISFIPSVVLGLLLNILDGLSYGMIIFPIGEKIFSQLGSSGLSMFYISCIISQLVYSLGGSSFKAGIGSEMIEVTPFFHTMAASITVLIGEENPEDIIATTITTYAISSMLTGLVFFTLGKLKLGQLVGFFPRHILIGCIGGVGYFLVITGLEISSKLGSFAYNFDYLSQLLSIKTFLPIVLTLGLILLQHFNHNSLVLPSYFISVFILIHLIIILNPNWDLKQARDAGYMFETTSSSEPWFAFYRLYNFKKVHWLIILKQVPSMFALTFFGILHVPINVPALAVSTKQDDVDVDKELIAHGLSNFISGAVGSIQNYLVYTNSLLFIRAGADSRIAGIMLAIATFGILICGPVVIGFIPVCVVGSLIFLLGYELLKEALWDTWTRVNLLEYLTILTIVLVMGIYDFVLGIVIGIIVASFHFLFENTQIPIISKTYTGEIARSTVIRHPLQREFLSKIGKQIYVLKLQSFLFFGTIGKIEKFIKALFDKDNEIEIRYLILDFKNVLNIDFSAAEGLNRIKNFIQDQNAYLIISLGDKPTIATNLTNVGLVDVEIFHDLNTSLEWCENEFLTKYRQLQKNYNHNQNNNSNFVPLAQRKKSLVLPINTPRNNNFFKQATETLREENKLELTTTKTSNNSTIQEPLPLLLFAIQGILSNEFISEKYWNGITSYFQHRVLKQDDVLSFKPNESYFILIESGIISINHHINEAANIYETYLPRTILGHFATVESGHNIHSNSNRFQNEIRAKRDSIIWIIDDYQLGKLKQNQLELYSELLIILFKLNDERFENVAGYSLISI